MDQDPKKTNETNPQEENPIKKAAMTTFGAISSAVENVAEVIGDVVSKEKREKYAKKGEETFSTLFDKGEELYHQVKDFSAQTYGKVKSAMEDPVTKAYSTPDAARDALASALKALQEEAADAHTTLRAGLDEDKEGPWAEKLVKNLNERTELATKLARRLQALTHKDDAPGNGEDDDTYFDKPVDGEIPYESPSAPRDERDRVEKAPADPNQSSAYTPDKDSNSSVLETDMKNEHLQQSVPPEMG